MTPCVFRPLNILRCDIEIKFIRDSCYARPFNASNDIDVKCLAFPPHIEYGSWSPAIRPCDPDWRSFETTAIAVNSST